MNCRKSLTWIFRTFVTNSVLFSLTVLMFSVNFSLGFRKFLTWNRKIRTWNRKIHTWIFSLGSYLYYVQKNFEGLGKTENKDYKITYKIIIKYQILFFEIFDYFLWLK